MMHGYLQDPNGDRSSSRLIVLIVVIAALVLAQEVLYFGRKDIVNAAIGAGTLFIAIAGPALAFLFGQKRTEMDSHNIDINKDNLESAIKNESS